MKSSVLLAVQAVVAGNASLDTLKVLQDNGCPPAFYSNEANRPILAKCAANHLLNTAEQAAIVAAGGDLTLFLGMKPKAVPAPAPTPNTATVEVAARQNIAPGVAQKSVEVKLKYDPFAFILSLPTTTAAQKKAARSLWNSMQSRSQTKVVEGYKAHLATVGVVIDAETSTQAMRATRAESGLDKMLDGVLSKKGFQTSRNEQDTNLIDGFRANLDILGVTITKEQHIAALEAGRANATVFANRVVEGLKARGLAFAV